MNRSQLHFGFIFLSFSSPAVAYIGPGMSGGILAAMIGIIGSIFLALFGVVYYPIRRMLRKRREMLARESAEEEGADDEEHEELRSASK